MGLSKTSSCFEISLSILSLSIKVKNLPSVHALGDFNFKEIIWPARLSKSGSMLSQSEGQCYLSWEPLCEPNFYDFFIKNNIGTQGVTG